MMPPTANENLPDNNRHALRLVVRSCRKAALASLMDGAPYASLVTVAFGHDLAPVLLLSGLSDHTRNIAADPRVSLLLDGTDGHPNPQTGPRVTLTGIAERTDDEGLKHRFLARHPTAAQYAGFGDFAFWRIRPQRAHFVGGFGRAVWFDAPFGLDPAACVALAAAEDGMLAGSIVSVDCDGCDIARPDGIARIAFPTPLEGMADIKTALKAIAEGMAD